MELSPTLGRGPVGVDASVVIYYVEANPDFVAFADELFDSAADSELELVTSALTLLEVLVKPYATDDANLTAEFDALPSPTIGGSGPFRASRSCSYQTR